MQLTASVNNSLNTALNRVTIILLTKQISRIDKLIQLLETITSKRRIASRRAAEASRRDLPPRTRFPALLAASPETESYAVAIPQDCDSVLRRTVREYQATWR